MNARIIIGVAGALLTALLILATILFPWTRDLAISIFSSFIIAAAGLYFLWASFGRDS